MVSSFQSIYFREKQSYKITLQQFLDTLIIIILNFFMKPPE